MTSRARRRRRLGVPEAAAVGGEGGPRTQDSGCSGSKALCPAGVGLRDNLGGPAGLAVPWPSPPLPSPATGKWGATPSRAPIPPALPVGGCWTLRGPPRRPLRPRALGRGVLGLPPITVAEAPTDAGLHPLRPLPGSCCAPNSARRNLALPSPLPASDRSSVLDTRLCPGSPKPPGLSSWGPLGLVQGGESSI